MSGDAARHSKVAQRRIESGSQRGERSQAERSTRPDQPCRRSLCRQQGRERGRDAGSVRESELCLPRSSRVRATRFAGARFSRGSATWVCPSAPRPAASPRTRPPLPSGLSSVCLFLTPRLWGVGSDKGQDEAPRVPGDGSAGPQTPETAPTDPAGAAQGFRPGRERARPLCGALSANAQVPPKSKADVSHWERRHFRLSFPRWSAGLSAPQLLLILTTRKAAQEGCRSPPSPAAPQCPGASLAVGSGLPPE